MTARTGSAPDAAFKDPFNDVNRAGWRSARCSPTCSRTCVRPVSWCCISCTKVARDAQAGCSSWPWTGSRWKCTATGWCLTRWAAWRGTAIHWDSSEELLQKLPWGGCSGGWPAGCRPAEPVGRQARRERAGGRQCRPRFSPSALAGPCSQGRLAWQVVARPCVDPVPSPAAAGPPWRVCWITRCVTCSPCRRRRSWRLEFLRITGTLLPPKFFRRVVPELHPRLAHAPSRSAIPSSWVQMPPAWRSQRRPPGRPGHRAASCDRPEPAVPPRP